MNFDSVLQSITVNAQSSVRFVCGGNIVYVDPFQLTSPAADADYIFITHDHYDHCSPDAIRNILKDTTIFVVPQKMSDNAALTSFGNKILSVKPGETLELSGFSVETIASYNKLKPFHPKRAGWVGYVFTSDGVRVYVAGDTDATAEAASVQCDIALVPIGGTYTMNAKDAAALVNSMQPKVAVPTHFGSIVGKPSDAGVFKGLVDPAIRVVEKLMF